ITNGNRIDTSTVRIRDLFKDSLSISAVKTGTLRLKDTFKLRSNIPLVSYDSEKFQVMARDSSIIESIVKLNIKYNWVEIYFPKVETQGYAIKLFPGALTEFFGKTNDTLQYNVNTKNAAEYGTLSLNLVNANRSAVIVQLVDGKFNVVDEKSLSIPDGDLQNDKNIFFDEITPDKYYIRIIYDENGNGKWDTGNFLDRKTPERIIYYPSIIEVRANW